MAMLIVPLPPKYPPVQRKVPAFVNVPPKLPPNSSKFGRFTSPLNNTAPVTQLLVVPDTASPVPKFTLPARYSASPPPAPLRYPPAPHVWAPPLNTSRDPAATRTSPACTL